MINIETINPTGYTLGSGRFALSGSDLPVYQKGDLVTIRQGERLIFEGFVRYSSLQYLELFNILDELHYWRAYQQLDYQWPNSLDEIPPPVFG